MNEIVTSVKRVAAIMGEIASASHEQRAGIEQVNEAVGQMDDITQQNAALVEEAAAASETMQAQAQKLAELVDVFRLVQGPSAHSARREGKPQRSQGRAKPAPSAGHGRVGPAWMTN